MFCGVYSSNAYTGVGVSYTCRRVSEGLASYGFETVVHVPWIVRSVGTVAYKGAVPRIANRPLRPLVKKIQEARFLREMTAAPGREKFAYLWPDASLNLVRDLKRRGIPTVREMINCHVGTAQRILDAAYRRRGFARGPIGDAHVAYEKAVLALVDRVVAPGKGVVDSLLEQGVDRSKIVLSSYGWEPDRILGEQEPILERASPRVFLFVGTLCLRKGVDTLVAAWRDSGVAGKLVLLGAVEPELTDLIANGLPDNVEHLPFSPDVAKLYRDADVFVIPSLEEGGPLVSYEALGAGLPIIATEMGGGYALIDGENGIVVPPDDQVALAGALREIVDTAGLARRYGRASRDMAAAFRWSRVAETRARRIHQSLFG